MLLKNEFDEPDMWSNWWDKKINKRVEMTDPKSDFSV